MTSLLSHKWNNIFFLFWTNDNRTLWDEKETPVVFLQLTNHFHFLCKGILSFIFLSYWSVLFIYFAQYMLQSVKILWCWSVLRYWLSLHERILNILIEIVSDSQCPKRRPSLLHAFHSMYRVLRTNVKQCKCKTKVTLHWIM